MLCRRRLVVCLQIELSENLHIQKVDVLAVNQRLIRNSEYFWHDE